jgi:pimeloyl-ACP methyl ester carboxylesterase
MENTKETRQYQVAEIQLTYESNVKPSLRPKISHSKDAYNTAWLLDELLTRVSPETWILDWERMSRPGNLDMQFELNCDYKNNIEMFPVFQQYFRTSQPPALIIWGKYEVYFDVAEALCYKRDLSNAQVHILDSGHMALETNFDEVLELISNFMSLGNLHETVEIDRRNLTHLKM